MQSTSMQSVTEAVDRAVAALDFDRLHKAYWAQNEFLVIKQFLPRSFVESTFVPQVEGLKPRINRNYIPGHKKGGSVSYYTVQEQAPVWEEE